MSAHMMRCSLNILNEGYGFGPAQNVLPHRDFLTGLANRDKASQKVAKPVKKYQPNPDHIQFGDVTISKADLASYANGDTNIPTLKLPISRNCSFEQIKAIRSDPRWRRLANAIYDQCLDRLTDATYVPKTGGIKRPNSSHTLMCQRILLIKDIIQKVG